MSSAIERERTRLLDWHRDRHAWRLWVSGPSNGRCVFRFFIKPILWNRYVRSRGFIVSEPRETHPRSEIGDVSTSPCPPLDNLGCLDLHPAPSLRRWLYRSPPLPLRTDLQLIR